MRCASRKVLVSSLHTAPKSATFHRKTALQFVLIKSLDDAGSDSRPCEPRGECPCSMLGVLHGASFHHGPSLIQRERRLLSGNITTRNQAAVVRECRAMMHLASTSTELSKPSVSTPNADCGGLGWAFGACPLGSWAVMGTHRTCSQPCLVQASFRSLYFSNLQNNGPTLKWPSSHPPSTAIAAVHEIIIMKLTELSKSSRCILFRAAAPPAHIK